MGLCWINGGKPSRVVSRAFCMSFVQLDSDALAKWKQLILQTVPRNELPLSSQCVL